MLDGVSRMPESFAEFARWIVRRMSKRKVYSLPLQMQTTVNATGNQIFQQSVQCEDLEPGVYTVQFDVVSVPLGASGGPAFDCKALVTFKCNGNNVTRALDVQQGVQISGMAEAINVVAIDSSTDADGAGNNYTVTANISAGQRCSYANPPILGVFAKNRAQAILAAGTVTVQIPTGFGVSSIKAIANPAPTATADVQVDIQNAAGNSLMTYGLSQHTEFVPIPGDASQIVFTNNESGTIKLSAQWGIDG